MKHKCLAVLLILVFSISTALACTIIGVGKNASFNSSTITSHTCDTYDADPRLLIQESMAKGTQRNITTLYEVPGYFQINDSLFLRTEENQDHDYVKGYYTNDKDTYQYILTICPIANEKGLSMAEATGFLTDYQKEVFDKHRGIIDTFMLMEATMENCATAKEAIVFMGNMVETYGWCYNPETILIADGTDLWVFEVYGGTMWCSFKLEDDAVFFCSNRSKINFLIEDNPEIYLYNKNMKAFALENGLWDGKSDFTPCVVFTKQDLDYCTMREWRIINLLTDLNLDEDLAYTKTPSTDFPLFVRPKEKLDVETIRQINSDYFQGTSFDLSKEGFPLGNTSQYRAIATSRSVYTEVCEIKSYLPIETRTTAYFGWGPTTTSYLTPIFPVQSYVLPMFTNNSHYKYSEESGYWNQALVLMTSALDFPKALQTIQAQRDPLIKDQYKLTDHFINVATQMVNNNEVSKAKLLLSLYSAAQANYWFDMYSKIFEELSANMKIEDVNSIPLPEIYLDILKSQL